MNAVEQGLEVELVQRWYLVLHAMQSEHHSTLSLSFKAYLRQMINEEFFRLYVLWTFAIGSVHTIIYLVVFLGQYRTAFFIFLGIITVTVLLYWFRDGGTKYGWQSLNESLLVLLFLSVILCILMIIASIIAVKALNNYSQQEFNQCSAILFYCYHVSPLVILLLNTCNLFVFLARN